MLAGSIWLVAFVASLSPPGETGDVLVEVIWTGRDHAPTVATARNCFGGTSIDATLRVYGSAGKQIDITAQLHQISRSLAAPVGGPLEVVAGLSFGATARAQLEWSVELPAVERPTTFELRFYARDVADTSFKTVGRQSLHVHPSDLLRELRAYSAKTPIVVEDPDGRLIPFLRAHGIEHVDVERVGLHGITQTKRSFGSGAGDPPEVVRLAMRVCPTETGPRTREHDRNETEIALLKQGYRIIRFREKADTMPAIVVERTDRSVLIDVEMPLLSELTESPAAQLLLLEIVRRANEEATVQPSGQ